MPLTQAGPGRLVTAATTVALAAGAALGLALDPAAAAACPPLVVGPVHHNASTLTFDARVPRALSEVEIPPDAFRLDVEGQQVPITVTRKATDRPVLAVVESSPNTSPAGFALAVAAVRDLVAELPAATPIGLVSAAGSPEVLAQPTKDHGAVLAALSDLTLRHQQGVAEAAVALAASLVPASGGAVLLLQDGHGPTVASGKAVLRKEVDLAVASYDRQGVPAVEDGCGPGTGPLNVVDVLRARLSGSYDVSSPAGSLAGATLHLSWAGQVLSAAVDPPRTSSPAVPARPPAGHRGPDAAAVTGLLAGIAVVTRLVRVRRKASATQG